MFWMVWKFGSMGPTCPHKTEEAARAEAERRTRLHGGKFYVLQAIAVVEKRDVAWTPLDEMYDGEIPF